MYNKYLNFKLNTINKSLKSNCRQKFDFINDLEKLSIKFI